MNRIMLWLHNLRNTSIILCLAAGAVWAQSAASTAISGLSPQDRATLDRGDILIRSNVSYRNLALKAAGAQADEIRRRIGELAPNYLSEVIATVPATDGVLEHLAASLADVKGYIGIPYWSKRWQKNFDLFDKMEIRSQAKADGGETIDVVQHMLPFDDFGARYSYRLDENSLFFWSDNTSTIMYGSHEAVQTGHMLWMLYAFKVGDTVVFYGVGGVKAWDFFGLIRGRLEASFSGRVESFMRYMAARMR